MSSKILILTADAKTLVCHRGELIKSFAAAGLEVVAAADGEAPPVKAFLAVAGARYEGLDLQRSGLNPWKDLRSFWSILCFIWREKPDYFFAYTIKPVIYGSVAAWLCGVPRRFVLIPGLGYSFSPDGTWKQRLVQGVSSLFYAIALRLVDKVFLQNRDDEALLRKANIIPARVPVHVTQGSGVALRDFAYRPTDLSGYPETQPVRFVLVSRLLKSKGIAQYAEAARRLLAEGFHAEFHLAGPLDPGPDAVGEAEVRAWQAEGTLVYHGSLPTVVSLLRESQVFVLPTYYREGVPRAALEAMSVGLAIVTTNAVGSRETVDLTEAGVFARMLGEPVMEGRNGVLVRPRDVDALAEAMRLLLREPGRISRMGRLSRCLAEERFDVERVNRGILREMGFAPAARSEGRLASAA